LGPSTNSFECPVPQRRAGQLRYIVSQRQRRVLPTRRHEQQDHGQGTTYLNRGLITAAHQVLPPGDRTARNRPPPLARRSSKRSTGVLNHGDTEQQEPCHAPTGTYGLLPCSAERAESGGALARKLDSTTRLYRLVMNDHPPNFTQDKDLLYLYTSKSQARYAGLSGP